MGKRIRDARRARKLTQKELADELGISSITLNRYEKGHRSPNTDVLGKIVAILKSDSRWIVSGEVAVSTEADIVISSKSRASVNNYAHDSVLNEIIQLLKDDLPEAKDHILKILIGKKQMKEGLNSLGLTGN